jgi:hypothetical protein
MHNGAVQFPERNHSQGDGLIQIAKHGLKSLAACFQNRFALAGILLLQNAIDID